MKWQLKQHVQPATYYITLPKTELPPNFGNSAKPFMSLHAPKRNYFKTAEHLNSIKLIFKWKKTSIFQKSNR